MARGVSGSAWPARAQRAFVATEGHFAPLNDGPDSAVLDLSFGYALRGGYHLGDWRVVGHLERDGAVDLG